MQCPKCDFQYVVKNGHTHTGKQNFKYRDCAREFVMNPGINLFLNQPDNWYTGY